MGHTFTNHLYHVVFSTKQRRELITDEVKGRLHQYICGTARSVGGAILTIGGVKNHVHLLATIRPSVAVSDFVRDVKANSSKWASETVRDMGLFEWQQGYASFTVSASNRGRVAEYIERQEAHHRRTPFEGELARLLEKHGIEFDRAHYLD
jgi:REP element-mobilizing transposase RayT